MKVTPVNWKRLNPVIVTTVPDGPSSGQIDEIDGPIVSGVSLMAKAAPRTDNWPVVASVGTVVVICVGESIVNAGSAVDPTNSTEVTELRLVPLIVTVEPGAAVVGVNDVMVGGPAKSADAVAVPAEVEMLMGPVVTLVGTVAWTVVADTLVNDAAGVVPKRTAVAPERFAPVMVTTVPTAPSAGENSVIAADETLNVPAPTPVLTGVSTEMSPVTAFGGTATVIEVAVTVVGVVGEPLNFTAVAPVKLVPVRMRTVPAAPEVGLNAVTAGEVVVKQVSLVMGVAFDTTAIGPLLAPPGTAVVISVADTMEKEFTDLPLNVMSVTSAKFEPVM